MQLNSEMPDDLRNRMFKLFEQEVEGGVAKDMMQMVDEFIDYEGITQEEWDDNEYAICVLFDNHWFNCVGCGWTMPNECQTEAETSELMCSDCHSEED